MTIKYHLDNVSSQKVGARQLGLRVSEQTNYAPSCLAPTLPRTIEMIPDNRNPFDIEGAYVIVGGR
jgi:hypothetical protein